MSAGLAETEKNCALQRGNGACASEVSDSGYSGLGGVRAGVAGVPVGRCRTFVDMLRCDMGFH